MNIECIGDERYELGESPIWDPQDGVLTSSIVLPARSYATTREAATLSVGTLLVIISVPWRYASVAAPFL